MRLSDAFALDQARQRKHDRNTGQEHKQRKNQIVKAKPFPGHVLKLGAEKASGGVDGGTLAVGHLRERLHGAVEPHDPKHV